MINPRIEARIAEAHVRFRRMHVDVDQRRIERRATAPPPDSGRAGSSRHRRRGCAERISLSWTGRPLTKAYCCSGVAAVEGRHAGKAGRAAMPSRSASISMALSRNSLPSTCAMRASRSSPVAGNSSVAAIGCRTARSARSGKAIAMRLTTSEIAAASAFSVFMNFSRAGVAKKRSRTSTTVPGLAADGRTGAGPCRRQRQSRRRSLAPAVASG